MKQFWQAGLVVLTAGGLAATAALAAPAVADTKPAAGTPATASADVLPTAQTDGVVWSMVTVGTTVYATGAFTTARPAGVAAGGAGQVTRGNILAFDITTGRLLPFSHTLNGQGREIVASPSGDKVYVGGDFTTVDGVSRPHVAAFSTATGALDTGFAPTGITANVKALAATADTLYVGGSVSRQGTTVRTRLSAFKRADGTLLPWAPTADAEVQALVVTADAKRVIVGGRFQNLNGAKHVGIGAIDAVTGASAPWSSQPIPDPVPAFEWTSWVTDLKIQNGIVYGAGDGEGKNMFDGRFAADANTGNLVWLDNCYGATYGVYPRGAVLYSVSHAHDCSSLGAFNDSTPLTYHRALAETTAATGTDKSLPGVNSHYFAQPTPTVLHWYPTLSAGSVTGQIQAAWAITGSGNYLAIGGEFPKVNGVAQAGLARFAIPPTGTSRTAPVAATTLTPSLFGTPGRRVRVGWKTTWDQDNEALTYRVWRSGTAIPVYTTTATSSFWKTPDLDWTDTTPSAGSYTYTISVTDADGNTTWGTTSPAIQVFF